MQRIVIIGPSGSGKTTLAKKLSAQFNLPHFELDDLAWDKNWVLVETEEFIRRIQFLKNAHPNGWVICGNYSRIQNQFWPEADTIIWVDPPLWLCVWRILRRSIRYMKNGTTICNGNTQDWAHLLFDKDALIPWAIKTNSTRSKKYEAAMNDPQWANKTWHRLRTTQSVEQFLKSLND